MTKKTHEMQAEGKKTNEQRRASHPVSVSSFCQVFFVFVSSLLPGLNITIKLVAFYFSIQLLGLTLWIFDGFCPSVASPWFPADWHRFTPPPPSAIFFLFFLAVSVSVCRWFIAGWWYWNSTRVLAPRLPPIEIGFQLSFIYVTFVSNFRIGFQWKHGGVHGGRVSISLLAANVLNCG